MKRDILLVYSTTDGHTVEICERIRKRLQQAGNQAEMVSVGQLSGPEAATVLARHDLIVLGASIRYGRHSKQLEAFIARHAALLATKRNAFFSVNAVARKAEKRSPDTNPYVRKFLRRIAWQPQRVEVFAGKIDYPKYGFVDRNMIRLIMWMTKGPTDPAGVFEFTDWAQVDAFADRLDRA